MTYRKVLTLPTAKGLFPHILHIHYLIDSPTSQYRNSHVMSMIAKHEALFGVRGDWLYFEAGHGKGPCDGVLGAAKRRTDEAVKRCVASI